MNVDIPLDVSYGYAYGGRIDHDIRESANVSRIETLAKVQAETIVPGCARSFFEQT